MKAKCKFNSVGQGMFYSTQLFSNYNRQFNFVYDCGFDLKHTISKCSKCKNPQAIDKSIDDFKLIANNKINLLAISHFDNDHISHIPKLIKNMRLNTVMLPFVAKEVRFLLALYKCKEINSDDIYSDDLLELYSKPIQYFAKHGAKKIIILHGEDNDEENYDEEDYGDNINPIVPINNWDKEEDEAILIYNESEEYDELDIKKPELLKEYTYGNIHIEHWKGAPDFILYEYNWIFTPFNLSEKYDENIIKDIEGEVGKILRKYDYNWHGTLSKIKEAQKEFKNIYKFEGKINETSLFIKSRPSMTAIIDYDYPMYNFPCNNLGKLNCLHCRKYDYHNRNDFIPITLLTGDITLDEKAISELRNNHMWNGYETVLQLPHHGSRNNINISILHDLRNPACLVASYGLKNTYRHPAPELIEDIFYKTCHRFIGVNENKNFTYTICDQN